MLLQLFTWLTDDYQSATLQLQFLLENSMRKNEMWKEKDLMYYIEYRTWKSN